MIKNALKSAYYSSLYLLQADKLWLRKIKEQNSIVILNLHRISPVDNPFWSPLHPRMFEDLLVYLQQEFEVCLFRDLKEGKKNSKPLAILSFDDGYGDFIEYAMPLLEKYDMRANANIIPKCADGGKPLWNTQLYDFLSMAPLKLVNEIKLPDFTAKLTGDSRESKLKYGLEISRYFKNRPYQERKLLWEIIKPVLEKLEFQNTVMMTTNEIKEISAIHEIGGHSFSHESMEFESNEFFLQDLLNCQAFFNKHLNQPMNIYAFPNGSYRAEQVEILRTNNIDHILLVDEKVAKMDSDVFTRITFYATTKTEMRLKVLGF